MTTQTSIFLPSPVVALKSIPQSRDFYNYRRASKAISLFWPFRKRSKMFQSDACSLPKLNLILQNDDKIPKSVPTSPVLCPKNSNNDNKRTDDFSYISSCSSGYSSGYSSGDSATTEPDLDSTIAKVSATEIGSSGFILQPGNTINKVSSKKRNSKDNLHISPSSFLSIDSHLSDLLMSNNLLSSDISPIKDVVHNIPSSEVDDLLTSFKRPSTSSLSSTCSSQISTNEVGPRRRVRDEQGFILRAACVCVNEDETKVVLISSKNSGGGWLVPGGGLEEGEEEAAAAIREAWEEAGITGSIKRRLGIFQMEDCETHKRKRTAVYVLKVLELHSAFPEARLGRVREWYSIEAAITHLSNCKPHQIEYLRALYN